jgi:hypothetical protein
LIFNSYHFKTVIIFCVCFYVSGCALPFASSAFSVVSSASFVESTAINGASYVTTGKSVSEHLISGMADQDCKLFNVIDGKKVCQEYQLDKIPQKDLTTRYYVKPPQSVEEVIQLNTK